MTVSENIKGVSGIYCAIHRTAGICYVGSSIDIAKRRKEHLWKSRHGSMNRFHRALREFGELAFDFEVLERCSKEHLLEREKFYIAFLGATEIDGLNCRSNPNATYDYKASEITRKRISDSKKGRLHTEAQRLAQSAGQRGLKRSPESRKNISDSLRGIPKSDEHKRKLSQYRKGRKSSPETIAKQVAALIGRPCTEESRKKQRDSRIRKMAAIGPEYADIRKPIIATDSSGDVLHVFESLLEAVAGIGTPNSSLRYYLRTGRVTPKGMLLYYATIARLPALPLPAVNTPAQ